MGLASGIAIYFIIWWLTFYVVLTVGNRRPTRPEDLAEGSDRGAPDVPRLRRRVIATTILSAAIFAGVYAILTSGLTLEDIPFPGPPGIGTL